MAEAPAGRQQRGARSQPPDMNDVSRSQREETVGPGG